jgi:pyridoxine 5-phosphate synthase
MRLGLNIDHIATLREVRKTDEPDLLQGAKIAQNLGVEQITVHLRADRRHIQDQDLEILKANLKIPLNVEMSTRKEMREIAAKIRPSKVTLVPERKSEVTTEGGLDVIKSHSAIERFQKAMRDCDVDMAIFVDPNINQIQVCHRLGIPEIEINTAAYADSPNPSLASDALIRIRNCAELAHELGIRVAAGHGLTTKNIGPILDIKVIEELNIGHHIIADSVFTGLEQKLREVLQLLGR